MELNQLRSGDLLEALTLRSADELFNMEKLEIVGDVFLKYRYRNLGNLVCNLMIMTSIFY
jgi:hypothetical protein